jgi:hypothetical protein
VAAYLTTSTDLIVYHVDGVCIMLMNWENSDL